jgi:hypothetical protein
MYNQIAKDLQPLDLIHLSRANKRLREVFMRRSAVLIWRAVLLNVRDLPPCPLDLCEPQYAAMLFLKECSVCPLRKPKFKVDTAVC